MGRAKINTWVIFVISLLVMFVSACGNSSQPHSSNEAVQGNNEENSSSISGIVPFYTPPSGGIAYVLAAGISQIKNNESVLPDIQFSVQAESGDTNIIDAVSKRYEQGLPAFGVANSMALNDAYAGNYKNLPHAHNELRAVGHLTGSPIYVVVREDAEIETFQDLKGKRVGVSPNSTFERFFIEIMESVYGLTTDDFELQPFGFGEVQDGIQNGSLDAGILLGGEPSPLVRELASSVEIKILSLTADEVNKYLKAHPNREFKSLKAGVYEFQNSDLLLPSVTAYIFTHENVPDDVVYNYLELIMTSPDKLKAVHPSANVNPNTVLTGINVPLHPGAENYLKEIDVLN